jgi:hypothetical protein
MVSVLFSHDNTDNFVTYFILKVKFFQDLGVRNDGIANMLVKFPPLLTYSLYKKIRPVVCPFPFQLQSLFPLIYFSKASPKFLIFVHIKLTQKMTS